MNFYKKKCAEFCVLLDDDCSFALDDEYIKEEIIKYEKLCF